MKALLCKGPKVTAVPITTRSRTIGSAPESRAAQRCCGLAVLRACIPTLQVAALPVKQATPPRPRQAPGPLGLSVAAGAESSL
ncbi:hypothetical protein GCM10010215_42050 [Streptomyces virginiae]|uniref:Uncharacterized protein n=1 Tax=Streptomyces virginiae TaxID=1961 RepID=A0ABQ3NPA3_STRVG|nr:hypothetical protein GCM10010215_42050 [Streptomyces virginiae]GHI14618.1 hypothetical protein Scinn_40810 [Streptomyces virginiae]